jgi:hypothetical protein
MQLGLPPDLTWYKLLTDWGSLFGSGVALVAGILTYLAAVRQVRLAEREHKAKVAAYKSRMIEIAVGICDHAWINSFHTNSDEKVIRIESLTVPEELGPSNWLDHALLGQNVVTAISRLYSDAKEFVEFSEEMQGKPAEAPSESFGRGAGDELEPGIDTYRAINQSLRESADALRLLLINQMRASIPVAGGLLSMSLLRAQYLRF